MLYWEKDPQVALLCIIYILPRWKINHFPRPNHNAWSRNAPEHFSILELYST